MVSPLSLSRMRSHDSRRSSLERRLVITKVAA
jgi:hypothetical protein